MWVVGTGPGPVLLGMVQDHEVFWVDWLFHFNFRIMPKIISSVRNVIASCILNLN